MVDKLHPKSKEELKRWKKQEKVKLDAILQAFQTTNTPKEVEIVCYNKKKGDNI